MVIYRLSFLQDLVLYEVLVLYRSYITNLTTVHFGLSMKGAFLWQGFYDFWPKLKYLIYEVYFESCLSSFSI